MTIWALDELDDARRVLVEPDVGATDSNEADVPMQQVPAFVEAMQAAAQIVEEHQADPGFRLYADGPDDDDILARMAREPIDVEAASRGVDGVLRRRGVLRVGDRPVDQAVDEFDATTDDDGYTFRDHVIGVLLDQPGNSRAYLDRTSEDMNSKPPLDGNVRSAMAAREALWQWKLARVRPAITAAVAKQLLGGATVTKANVEKALCPSMPTAPAAQEARA